MNEIESFRSRFFFKEIESRNGKLCIEYEGRDNYFVFMVFNDVLDWVREDLEKYWWFVLF